MKTFRLALFVLAFAGLAQARPVVIEESARITMPEASWEHFGRFGVAIDGDYALISGDRVVADPSAPSGVREEGVVFLFRRSGSTWNYQGRLGPVSTITQWNQPGLAMKDGVAVTWIGITRIFELNGGMWTRTPLSLDIENNLQGPDIEIDGGRILMARKDCVLQRSTVLRKVSGAWVVDGDLPGQNPSYCTTYGGQLDIDGGHAIVHNREGPNGEGPQTIQYRLNENGVGWRRTHQAAGYFPADNLALNWPNWAIPSDFRNGSRVGYEVSEAQGAWSPYGLQPADAWITPDSVYVSTNAIERFRDGFLQRNYSYDRETFVVNLFRMNDDAAHSSEHVATLQASDGGFLGTKFDSSGNSVIVSGLFGNSGNNTVRVFEIPTALEALPVQVHDFELASAGAAWQPSSGSSFSVVRVGGNGLYRQPSTTGNPSSTIPSSATTNQAIQVEVTPRAITGSNAWVGLTTRRNGESYYYVTLRTSGAIELKLMRDGAFTTLAAMPFSVSLGQKYRLRLESIGSAHRVYVDDVAILSARDATLSQGVAGVMTNRTSADFDNVLVTPTPFTTIDTHFITDTNVDAWTATSGDWLHDGFGLHQRSLVNYGRNITGATTDDQIVQARIRPNAFAGNDDWVGLMARYRDDRNYLYVSLRARGVVSLWRRTDGVITQLATQRLTVTPGTWYTVRVEVVAGRTRVFVNEQLLLASNADPGPVVPDVDWSKGQVGVITYRATADFDDFLAYQP